MIIILSRSMFSARKSSSVGEYPGSSKNMILEISAFPGNSKKDSAEDGSLKSHCFKAEKDKENPVEVPSRK